MALEWKPSAQDQAIRLGAMKGLFFAGIDKRMDSQRLCALAADISRLAPHDFETLDQLSQALIDYAPDSPQAWFFRSRSLSLSGSNEEAQQACERGLTLDPNDIDLRMQRAKFLIDQGDLDIAEAQLRELAKVAPGFTLPTLGHVLLSLGKADEAWEMISRLEAMQPPNTALLALKQACALVRGDEAALMQLQDDGLIQQIKHAADGKPATTDRFNAQLAECIRGNSHLVEEPESTATISGAQGFIEKLLPQPLIDQLFAMIRSQVETYVQERADHPYMGNAPRAIGITCWAVSLRDSGYQAPHVHPSGWLSGVYYVDVGEAGSNADAGAIEFWQPPADLVGDRAARITRVQPKNGMMLIFPSYTYHRTTPHSGASDRLSIAFDIG